MPTLPSPEAVKARILGIVEGGDPRAPKDLNIFPDNDWFDSFLLACRNVSSNDRLLHQRWGKVIKVGNARDLDRSKVHQAPPQQASSLRSAIGGSPAPGPSEDHHVTQTAASSRLC